MVFAGEDDDPGTVAALTRMGYSQPAEVWPIIRGWHHGRYPAVRTPRARERLTEVQPLLVAALAETADPDRALSSFDRFLSELPAGVQLFSLLRANPAPAAADRRHHGHGAALARILRTRRRAARRRARSRLLRHACRRADELDRIVAAEIGEASTTIQDVLDRARLVGSEQQFLIGVRVLTGSHQRQPGGRRLRAAGRAPDRRACRRAVERELVRAHGQVPGGARRRRRHGQARRPRDDGRLRPRPHRRLRFRRRRRRSPTAPGRWRRTQYYTRLTQRLISALSAPTAEGTLYEVDMRLRPSGQQGAGRHAAVELRRLPGERGLDLGAHGADARPRHLRAAGAARARRGGDPRTSLVLAARPGEDRRRRARHARAHRQGEGHRRHLGSEAGARRPGRSGVHRPVPATRACARATPRCSTRTRWRPSASCAMPGCWRTRMPTC